MLLLITGLLLWTVVHFVPSAGIRIKQRWIEKSGEKPYTIAFTLLILAALLLIIFGWRSSTPSYLYSLPGAVRGIALLLVIVGFLFFGAAKHQTRIKRFVRHPQLTGLIFWSIAHLLLNGDSRSVVLFGWLGIWAVAEIFLINRREGKWVKPEIPTWGQEIKGHAISLVIIAVAVAAHPYLAGVAVR